jgi:isocitrate dehydrogenase (NAD+)
VTLAAALMLDHLNCRDKADRIRKAVRATIAEHDRVTPDLDGDGTTDSFTDAILERLDAA